jgi:hypothetical protein
MTSKQLKRLRRLKNPHIDLLLDEIRALKHQNRQLRQGHPAGTPIAQQPMPQERAVAIINLAYADDPRLQQIGQMLVRELDSLEGENRELSQRP